MTTPPVVLMLTEGLTLDDVKILATDDSRPTIYSVTVYSSANPNPQGIVGTEAQLVRMRDVIDHAVDRARNIERQHRIVAAAPVEVAQRAIERARRELAAALDAEPDAPLSDLLDRLEEHTPA